MREKGEKVSITSERTDWTDEGEEWRSEGPAGCHVGVRPAGGRGAMQGVGGDSSVSHCTQGVTSAGWEREKKKGETERRRVDRETKR